MGPEPNIRSEHIQTTCLASQTWRLAGLLPLSPSSFGKCWERAARLGAARGRAGGHPAWQPQILWATQLPSHARQLLYEVFALPSPCYQEGTVMGGHARTHYPIQTLPLHWVPQILKPVLKQRFAVRSAACIYVSPIEHFSYLLSPVNLSHTSCSQDLSDGLLGPTCNVHGPIYVQTNYVIAVQFHVVHSSEEQCKVYSQ